MAKSASTKSRKAGATLSKAARAKYSAEEKALSAAMAAAERAGGAFVSCKPVDHSQALNNFGNASAILVVLLENRRSVNSEDLNDALWGVRDLIKHGLELMGEEVRS